MNRIPPHVPHVNHPGTYNIRGARPVGRLQHLLTHLSPSTSTAHAPTDGITPAMTSTAGRKLPTFDELPSFKDFAGCAWEVWGKDDQLGTVNLLTEEAVKEASKEIKYVDLRPEQLIFVGAF